jgi:hypothetical protein
MHASISTASACTVRSTREDSSSDAGRAPVDDGPGKGSSSMIASAIVFFNRSGNPIETHSSSLMAAMSRADENQLVRSVSHSFSS